MTDNKNPITQLKQHKTAKNEPKEPVKAKNNINTPIKGEGSQNRNQSVLVLDTFPQVTYTFTQAKWGVANCKKNYPGCFHLKKGLQRQLGVICKNLHQTDRLLAGLNSEGKLTAEQQTIAKYYKRLSRYLTKQMQGVIDYVEQVEQAEGEELDALCYRKDESRTDEYRGK